MAAPSSEVTPSVSALPSPPFVDIQGIPNFRDIGGYPVTSSTNTKHLSIRRHFIYRCAQTSTVTPEGEASLRAANILTMYDFRSEPELLKYGTPVKDVSGVTRRHVPVYKTEDYSPEKLAVKYQMYSSSEAGEEGFVRAYRDILGHAAWSYKPIFEHIRDCGVGEGGFVVHCTAGKDRTGVFVALVLKLAGVEDEVVAREYNLTEKGLGDWRKAMMDRLAQEKGVEQGEGRSGVERMTGSRYESMIAMLGMLKEEWGGAEGWLKKECGFDEKDFEKMRKNLIVEEPAIL